MKTIAISILGTQLDYAGKNTRRWSKWRPNVGLCSQPDLIIDELHLLHEKRSQKLADTIEEDIHSVSPETSVTHQLIEFQNPWDFEEVYSKLFDFCRSINFDTDKNNYLFHITTGTHVAQICAFLLTESRHFPGRLIQTSPAGNDKVSGTHQIIDLDLSRYDHIASRFREQRLEGEDFLKGGIATKNRNFNQLITQVEKVAIRSQAPILFTGPTGAGKSQLASRVYELKKRREMVSGPFVSVNCATLRGDNAMAALFGHTKGAFTGAQRSREGFLKSADQGVLFLDEIGELGLDEQAMLLHALENKSFYPVGSDKEINSDFQLIAGTNRNLFEDSVNGRFREDLLARINLWTYQLPALKERREDIEPNIDYELRQYVEKYATNVDFNKEARDKFLAFALSPSSQWKGNFRDLNAAIIRMATLAEGARITLREVKEEIERLSQQWSSGQTTTVENVISQILSSEQIADLDSFDQNQLNYVLNCCRQHPSMAAAGRELFNVSRTLKKQSNDSSRLQKYLAKFSISWADINK
ncbi:RNA repair transcriptional activator RtcR [Pleionea sp. CnH1-48]|uniref:RNA repair transcriptional activator RtcR n=1 Tax=Pleionea sp. CnH1-48 TaxID=2954494 RepID=UPI0020974679|nr:RNA repair transcriptional activator RtcR [Pleionea sp. CnH1-48]MCO7225215.1 RNA repair transcriptional activator RtcR [Pleionea sp. CnH1-48]